MTPQDSRKLHLLFGFLDEVSTAMPKEEVEEGPPPMTEEQRIAARLGVDRLMAKIRGAA